MRKYDHDHLKFVHSFDSITTEQYKNPKDNCALEALTSITWSTLCEIHPNTKYFSAVGNGCRKWASWNRKVSMGWTMELLKFEFSMFKVDNFFFSPFSVQQRIKQIIAVCVDTFWYHWSLLNELMNNQTISRMN